MAFTSFLHSAKHFSHVLPPQSHTYGDCVCETSLGISIIKNYIHMLGGGGDGKHL